MQVASKQSHWAERGVGTVIEVEMTLTTGLYICFHTNATASKDVQVSWGDGDKDEIPYTPNDIELAHTFATYGKYKIVIKGIRSIGFRNLDGEPLHGYDAAILSLVDYAGQLEGSRSGAFQSAANLTRFIAPNCGWMGQRDFAYCPYLEEVVLGPCGIYYDGTFQSCPKLTKFTTGRSWMCWSYVWQGCTSLTELRLGDVNQFATQDFANTPQLADIYIANKTVDQIKQVAASGNIVAGYGAKFPWGATAVCRFHGTDGIVLGNGTIIR